MLGDRGFLGAPPPSRGHSCPCSSLPWPTPFGAAPRPLQTPVAVHAARPPPWLPGPAFWPWAGTSGILRAPKGVLPEGRHGAPPPLVLCPAPACRLLRGLDSHALPWKHHLLPPRPCGCHSGPAWGVTARRPQAARTPRPCAGWTNGQGKPGSSREEARVGQGQPSRQRSWGRLQHRGPRLWPAPLNLLAPSKPG